MNEEMKIGDRVRIVAPDDNLLKYMMQKEANGTILRFKNNKIRVEVDGSESQDTEGYKAYSDFDADQITLLTPSLLGDES